MRGVERRLGAVEPARPGVPDWTGGGRFPFRELGRSQPLSAPHAGGRGGEPAGGRAQQADRSKKGATSTQIALAWLLARNPWIVPVPATRMLHPLEENLAAAAVALTPAEVSEIDTESTRIPVTGGRGTEREVYG
jgi:aryl-alcohol dehydrogenase-like predicted oxidoreductase